MVTTMLGEMLKERQYVFFEILMPALLE